MGLIVLGAQASLFLSSMVLSSARGPILANPKAQSGSRISQLSPTRCQRAALNELSALPNSASTKDPILDPNRKALHTK